jgi:hypothetical protein
MAFVLGVNADAAPVRGSQGIRVTMTLLNRPTEIVGGALLQFGMIILS